MPAPLRDRMQAFEATPPPGSWQQVADAITDLPAETALRDRLQAYEAAPPAGAWTAIAGSLQADSKPVEEFPEPAKVEPVRPLYPFLVRYAGIAAAIALAFWGINTGFFDGQEQHLNTSLTRSKTPAPVTPVLPHALPRVGAEASTAAFTHSIPPFSALRQLPAATPDVRYLRITNEQGQPVRLSAKFAPMYYQLLSDLETQSGNARQQLQQLQQQLQESVFSPDPGNLFDLLRMPETVNSVR